MPSLLIVARQLSWAASLRAQAAQFVALCVCKDADRRPSAAALLKHVFLRQARDKRWLAQRLLGPARHKTGSPRDLSSHARRTMSAKEASAQVCCMQPIRFVGRPLFRVSSTAGPVGPQAQGSPAAGSSWQLLILTGTRSA